MKNTKVIIKRGLDASIQSEVSTADVKIYKSLNSFMSYIQEETLVVSTVFVDTATVPFNESSVAQLKSLKSKAFIKLDNICFLTESEPEYDKIVKFIKTLDTDDLGQSLFKVILLEDTRINTVRVLRGEIVFDAEIISTVALQRVHSDELNKVNDEALKERTVRTNKEYYDKLGDLSELHKKELDINPDRPVKQARIIHIGCINMSDGYLSAVHLAKILSAKGKVAVVESFNPYERPVGEFLRGRHTKFKDIILNQMFDPAYLYDTFAEPSPIYRACIGKDASYRDWQLDRLFLLNYLWYNQNHLDYIIIVDDLKSNKVFDFVACKNTIFEINNIYYLHSKVKDVDLLLLSTPDLPNLTLASAKLILKNTYNVSPKIKILGGV